MMRGHIFIILLLASVILCGCVDELFVDNNPVIAEGELTDCRIGLNVENFQMVSSTGTRAVSDTDTIASEAERAVNDIWVFQYGADSSLLIKPRYYEKSSKDGDKWEIQLSVASSTIYVVANTSDNTWATNYEDFSTLEKLKTESLPKPEPIQVGDSTGEVKASEVSIPMSGYINVDNTAFSAGNTIEIPVVRMYAKLIISSQMIADMTMTSIEVNNIPYTCQIEARSTDPYQATGSDYASARFITRSYYTVGDKTTLLKESNNSLTQDYVIYVPENIQGIANNYLEDGQTLKGKDYSFGDPDCPTNALDVNFHLKIKKDGSDGTVNGSAYVFPGANNTNNFNVNRNYVYKVKANFLSKEYFFPTPSSNCFVVTPGETLTFWPYYRTETGGGYSFKTYLDPTVEDKKIAKLKIIWQDKDVIGDNSNGDLVYVSETAGAQTDYDNIIKNFTIGVKTKKEGNALIGAYNSKDEIIWSWHIWVTDNNPDNVGNAIRYTTYDWDATGIHTDKARVPGYQVMPCNLGAKEFEPTSADKTVTYGPLYQWGRKDPFPQMKYNGKKSGMYQYNPSGSNVQVYDNANIAIEMGKNVRATAEGTSGTTLLFKTVKCTATSTNTSEEMQRADGLKYSINHPTVFISAANVELTTGNYNSQGSYINNGDWLLGHDDQLWGGLKPDLSQNHRQVVNAHGAKANDDILSYMWDNYGSEKTIFDPCPSGWRVPPSDLWMGLTSDGESVHLNNIGNDKSKFIEYINCTESIDKDIAPNNGFHMYLDGWKTGNTTFFPSPGVRLADGQPFHLGICGNYHNATSAPMVKTTNGVESIVENGRVNCLHFHSETSWTQVNVFENQRLFVYKAIAGPIRCVRDKK